jgi:hypothetical protein
LPAKCPPLRNHSGGYLSCRNAPRGMPRHDCFFTAAFLTWFYTMGLGSERKNVFSWDLPARIRRGGPQGFNARSFRTNRPRNPSRRVRSFRRRSCRRFERCTGKACASSSGCRRNRTRRANPPDSSAAADRIRCGTPRKRIRRSASFTLRRPFSPCPPS